MNNKEVMQMALDWFHWFQHGTNPNGAHVLEVEEALRTALSQPEPAECDGGQCGIGGYCKQCPKTQHELEPVAWTVRGLITDFSRDFSAYQTKTYTVPLYTAPPQREWVGLTDEELLDLADMAYANDLELLQTLQAKLKEKNS
jgi:hypothetical protein